MTDFLLLLPVLLISVIVHEIAHGYTALRLGDPTAKQAGRLTANPIPHIDLVGSILVPLVSVLVAGRVFIAWAKPVPVNPANFRHFRRDDILVSVMGPASNLALAFLFSVITGIVLMITPGDPAGATEFFVRIMLNGIYLNVILAVFNMLPIPPLDGSHVLASLLPQQLGDNYRRIGFLGIFIVLLLLNNPTFRGIFMSIIDAVAIPFIVIIRFFTG
jgi:Zn-dependent protease